MPILINDTSPRAQYTATSGQTAFTIPFEFFANSDLKVYKNAVLLTLTTDYTATGAGVTGGGTLTLVVGAATNDIITIVRDVPVSRTSDFPTSGPFNIEALNTDLDRLVAMSQQQEARDTRTLRLSDDDTPATLATLPLKADRAGKIMAFDANGNPSAGSINLPSTLTALNYVRANSAATAYELRSPANVRADIGADNATNLTSGTVDDARLPSTMSTKTLTNVTISSGAITGITDLAIADGGTGASSASAARSNLGLAIGTDVQAYDPQLADIAGLTPSDNNFIVGNGTNFVTESGATARTSLGLGSIATQDASNVSITGGSISGVSFSLATPVVVPGTSSATGEIRLAEDTDNGTNYVGLKAPASISADISWTLPAVDGITGQFLSTDGSGVLSWSSPAGAGDVVGPASSTDNAIVRFDSTSGKAIQNSGVTIADDNATVISGSSTADMLRITQTGTGNALLIEDDTNPDSSPFQINASGQVSIGTTTASGRLNIYDPTAAQAFISGDAATIINLTRYSSDNAQANVVQRKARGTLASPTAVNSGDGVGTFVFNAYGGTTFRQIGTFTAGVETYTSDTNISGFMSFSVNSGGTTVTERMRIDSAGQVRVGVGSAGAPSLSVLDDTNTGIFFPAADTVAISAAGTEDFRIGPAGQIGIQGANYGTSGQVLTSGGSGAAPSWATPAAGGFSNMEVFAASGTFNIPAGVTKVKVTVIGGGGAGGGSGTSSETVGNGGGAGGAAIKIVSGLTPGGTVTVTVGAGGTGVSNATGNSGGTSSFGAHCSATGGTGGTKSGSLITFRTSAANGSGSGGDINLSGFSNHNSAVTYDAGGTRVTHTSGRGGDTPLGYGSGALGVDGDLAGVAGSGYGSGGSGSMSKTASTSRTGGAGAAGIVIVEY